MNDFEKLSRYWPKDDVIFITGLSRYDINIKSYLIFAKQYLDFRPDAILTDHGYGGFLLIDTLNKLLHVHTKTVFYLRGNWWLENGASKAYKGIATEITDDEITEPNLSAISRVKSRTRRLYYDKKAELHITSDGYTDFDLIDTSTGILISSFSKKIYKNKEYIRYKGLWQGIFTFKINGGEHHEEYLIDTKVKGQRRINKSIRYEVITQNTFSPGQAYKDFLFFIPLKVIRRLKKFFVKKLTKFGWNYTLKNIQYLTTVCEYLSSEARNRIQRKAIVVPVPVDTNLYPKSVKDLRLKHPSVLILQNHQIKQKSEALVSFKEVIERTPKITYYISRGLPHNRDNAYYSNVISALTPLKNVKFVDIDKRNKYDYLNSVDLYVLRSGLDCTPATILEAGLAKKPVIVSDVGGVPEMVIPGKTGWYIKNTDNDSWIKQIDSLISDKSKLLTMGKNNFNHVKRHYDTRLVSTYLYEIMSKGTLTK